MTNRKDERNLHILLVWVLLTPSSARCSARCSGAPRTDRCPKTPPLLAVWSSSDRTGMLKIKTGFSESLILELKLATFLPQRHFVSFQRVFTRTVFCSKKADFDLCRKQEDACVCRREQLSGQVAENPQPSNTNFFSIRIKHPFLTYFASLIFWKSAPSDVMEGLIHHWQSSLVTDYTFSQLFTPPFEAEWPYLYSFGLFSSGGHHSESTASIQLHPLHPPIKQSIMWIWIRSYMLSIRQEWFAL